MAKKPTHELVFALAALLSMADASAAEMRLVADSEPGEILAQGVDADVDQDDHAWVVRVDRRGGIDVLLGNNAWRLNFDAPKGQRLATGLYPDVVRWPFNNGADADHPGLSLVYNATSCNEVTGWFRVLELDTRVVPPIVAIDFEHHCEGEAEAIRGSLRIGSDVPIGFDGAFAALARSRVIAAEGNTVTLDGSRSFSVGSTVATHTWTQLAGPAAAILNPTGDTTSVVLPDDVELGGEEVVIQHAVVDGLGRAATADVTIQVESKSDVRTYLELHSEPGDWVGQGVDRMYTTEDGSFVVQRSFGDGVEFDFEVVAPNQVGLAETKWQGEFINADSTLLAVGDHQDATHIGLGGEGAPGLLLYDWVHQCYWDDGLWGRFEVGRITWPALPFSAPTSVYIEFVQRCFDSEGPALTGTFSYNARHPSVPTAAAGADRVVVPGELVELDGSASTDPTDEPLGFAWSTDDPGVVIVGDEEQIAVLTAPSLAVDEASRQFEVKLLVRDPAGYKSTDVVTLTVMEHADLSVAVTAPTTRKYKGDKVKFTFVLRNHSSTVTAINPQVTAGFASSMARFLSGTVAGGVCASVGGTPRCTLPSIAPGAQVTGSFTVKALKKGTLSFTVTADATTEDLVPGNDSAMVSKRIR